ncbi:MAG TPA: 23S rRNA (guanosine(2251)-2'-O)-methyltransferase RlmB [Vicinamibacteria bacterium]|nr:23S rRNA (guanosine(2251)-2'-O)-methyltransferase RlmB [Vicinamibacteria bacterium]
MQLICGINPVLEALHAGTRHFDRLLVVKGIRNRRVSEAISRAGQMGIPMRFEPRETLDRMAGGIPHQGLIAVVSAKPVTDIESVLEQAREPALLLLLDGVEDPRNLGAILRTADAAGVDGVFLPERHSAGLSETVARASAGGLEYVKVARVGNVSQAIDKLKERGLWVVGFDASGTERWDAVDYRRPIVFVLGGEGRGIRRLVRERCDHLVSLPLFGHVNSLNVSVAAGIALYEAVRQRGTVPSHVRPIPLRGAAHDRHVIGPGPEDGEHDPGAPPDRAHHHHGEHEDDERPSTVTLAFDHDEEPAWAMGGPTVLKAPRHRRDRDTGMRGAGGRPRGKRRGGGDKIDRRLAPRPERPRPDVVNGEPGEAAPGQAGAEGGVGAEQAPRGEGPRERGEHRGRRRRRRNGRDRGPRGAGGGGGGRADGDRGPGDRSHGDRARADQPSGGPEPRFSGPEGGSEGAARGPAEGAPGGGPPGRRRRRRRRR